MQVTEAHLHVISFQPPPPQPTVYDFPIKRILLTRDQKERSVKGTLRNIQKGTPHPFTGSQHSFALIFCSCSGILGIDAAVDVVTMRPGGHC